MLAWNSRVWGDSVTMIAGRAAPEWASRFAGTTIRFIALKLQAFGKCVLLPCTILCNQILRRHTSACYYHAKLRLHHDRRAHWSDRVRFLERYGVADRVVGVAR